MSHDTHVVDGQHKELNEFGADWFKEQTKNWKDPYGLPEIQEHDGIIVVRDDKIVGSKCRFADLLVQSVESDTIVYVQPRVGLAGVSILEIAKKYNKEVVLFMPASKEISDHQAACIERGAIPKFHKIAAMPNLNKIASEWATANGKFFVPLGLKHPLVVACAAKVASNLAEEYGEPDVCFVATSTGVLVRGLQIGWKNTEFYSIAVSRNMKAGELGRAHIISEPMEFQKPEKAENLPPFETVNTYDAKVWKYVKKYKQENPEKNVWMWNVGQEPKVTDISVKDRVDSARAWGELRN